MHGVIFSELKKFVDTKFGGNTWNDLMNAAGLGTKLYLPVQHYPDSDAIALVTAASKATGMAPAQILEAFGEFIAPSLLGMYRPLVKPQWKTLDLLENTENTIHTVVRQRNPGAQPAQLKAIRINEKTVELTYSSERKMCSVAKGIINGLAKHYGENVTVTETTCMHKGGEHCQMTVVVS